MNIQSLGSTGSASQARQAFAERSNAAPTSNAAGVAALVNSRNGVEDSEPASAVETSKAVEKAGAAPTLEEVTKAVENINKSLQSKTLQAFSQDLEFSVDSDTERMVVKVVDRKTKEVIRQIPSEETLEIAKSIDTFRGLLIRQQA